AEENETLRSIRDHLIERILKEIPDTTLNGHHEKRLPQNANISFHYIEGESITLHLDMHGYAVSTGSACFSRSLEGSHVIFGIGGDHERAHGSIRFTFGRYNTREEVDGIVDVLKDIVRELRSFSPLARDKNRKETE
ncbi:MAG: aminotransferase class V-fold PLP-dependent enzyme, partial [Dehalococcoidales bacterium]|nr:aminotransferase class V-fold PLP-dependent enzyme [Dehalococcoidales bacterium]